MSILLVVIQTSSRRFTHNQWTSPLVQHTSQMPLIVVLKTVPHMAIMETAKEERTKEVKGQWLRSTTHFQKMKLLGIKENAKR
jgi:hypothetical protein